MKVQLVIFPILILFLFGCTASSKFSPEKVLTSNCQQFLPIIEYDNNLYVLEANMKFGKEGFRRAGIDYLKLMERMIENGQI